MKITLLKWHNSTRHCDVVHRLILQLQAMKTPDAKAAVDKEWGNRGCCQHGKNQKSKANKELSIRRRKKAKTFFATLMDLCHLKNYDLDKKFQTYKGRFVLR